MCSSTTASGRIRRRRLRRVLHIGALTGLAVWLAGAAQQEHVDTPMVVFGYNDLGMHCMNDDFSEIMILPPFNTLHAQVIRRGVEPDIIRENDVIVRYVIPSVTHAADRVNFWSFPQPLLGNPPPNVGVFGAKLMGRMTLTGNGDWSVVGIPVTVTDDNGRDRPYPLATITVTQQGQVVARTQAVVPVSAEISCNLCHNEAGVSTASDLLADHDRLHGTHLLDSKPVLCADCHASNALGAPGQPGLHNLSRAVHGAHADRMGSLPFAETCYACHPGLRTKCQRDVHFSRGITCSQCHGDMNAVADPGRNPWFDEPSCGSCHSRPGFEFEQPGTLYRNSIGHKEVMCAACHGSPHAITPTVTPVDNSQAIHLQGYAGVINDCTVCHDPGPPGAFFHKVDD